MVLHVVGEVDVDVELRLVLVELGLLDRVLLGRRFVDGTYAVKVHVVQVHVHVHVIYRVHALHSRQVGAVHRAHALPRRAD
jgi:hypothetical protein